MIRRAAIAALLAALFWLANRGAYRGYFFGDDLDNLAWTRAVAGGDFLKALVSPAYTANNFRPTGHGLYHVWGQVFGLRFPPYVATIQLLHLLNALLLFWLMRRSGASDAQAGVGALFWVFHMALFGAFWRPMYVFDVLCGLFTLVALLAWSGQRWVMAFVCFWLAMKSKEHAVLLPAVLLLWEWTLGERRWKPLVPFFAASLGIGLQGVFANEAAGPDYKLNFSPLSVLKTTWAYLPHFWFAALPLLAFWRRVPTAAWWGMAWFALLLSPMLALPGRINPVYLYVPLLGLALAAGCAVKPKWGVPLLALWLAGNFVWMRQLRRAELTQADNNRAYFEQLSAIGPALAEPELYIYDGYPEGLDWWGIAGAIRLAAGKAEARMIPIQADDLAARIEGKSVMQLFWEPPTRRLTTHIRSPQHPELSLLDMGRFVPFWQLGDGWYQQESGYRWSKPSAWATVRRPAGATRFELKVNIGPAYIEAVTRSQVRVRVDTEVVGTAQFDKQGWQTAGWTVGPKPAGRVRVEIEVSPPFRPGAADPRVLGVAVGSIGYPDTPR
ncbi:MAG: hypothetical protein J0L64_26320 [Acidobacteria bacterium]|nr:hypothetical protein [Acidobacteriota bacterium]